MCFIFYYLKWSRYRQLIVISNDCQWDLLICKLILTYKRQNISEIVCRKIIHIYSVASSYSILQNLLLLICQYSDSLPSRYRIIHFQCLLNASSSQFSISDSFICQPPILIYSNLDTPCENYLQFVMVKCRLLCSNNPLVGTQL